MRIIAISPPPGLPVKHKLIYNIEFQNCRKCVAPDGTQRDVKGVHVRNAMKREKAELNIRTRISDRAREYSVYYVCDFKMIRKNGSKDRAT